MKAIVLEVKDGYAAALREDGLIVKTRRLAEVGETVELSEKVVRFPSRGGRVARTAVAAALLLAVTGGAYTYTNVAAASYVTLDTEETSVELSVNRMGRVVGVRALDEASSELAEALAADVRRMRVEDAVDAAVSRMDGSSTVVAGVTGETEKRTADMQQALQHVAGRAERAGVELVTLEISRDERREAGEHAVSAGRWAFERGGGRWRDDGDGDDDARDDADGRDEDFDDDFDDEFADDFDRDDRPAFRPERQNGAAPVPPPDDGDAPAGPLPRMERDDGHDFDDGDFGDGGFDGDRPAPPEQSAQPPERGEQPPTQERGQTPNDATPPENDGARPPEEVQNGGQTPQGVPDGGQGPSEGGPFTAAPENGGPEPPRGGEAQNGGPQTGPGGARPGGAPQRQ